jgi:hypothetical protein
MRKAIAGNDAGVALLATRLSVKWRLVDDDGNVFAGRSFSDFRAGSLTSARMTPSAVSVS